MRIDYITKDNDSALYPLTFQVLVLQSFYQLPTSLQPATSATAGAPKKKPDGQTAMETLAGHTGSAILVTSFYVSSTSEVMIP
jgi:hypothetical protein